MEDGSGGVAEATPSRYDGPMTKSLMDPNEYPQCVHAKMLVAGDILRPMNYKGEARYEVVSVDLAAKCVVTKKIAGDLAADEHELEFTWGGGYHNIVVTSPSADRSLVENA